MVTVRHRLAKLTRPRLHAPVARGRLLRQLDDLRARPVVWITGPPGAGKTTLVASYLDEARLHGIWYQLDPTDADPATFFYFLGQAVTAATRRTAKPLPLLTPEYLPDLPGFARRFFREAFTRLPSQTPLVLDNYHEIPPDSPLHEALATAVHEIPGDTNVLVASRADPPAAFASAILHDQIGRLGWQDLKLTVEESEAVSAARGIGDAGLAKRLHAQTDGWFAGLALLLERHRHGEAARGAMRADALEVVFDFFASVIFDHATEDVRSVLLKVALLPRTTAALARSITGIDTAGDCLESLYRRHLFVERTVDAVPTYQLHALFRAFLRHRVQSALPLDERRAVARTAAHLLEASGEPQEAFMLRVDVEDWAPAEHTLTTAAPSLLAQGRWRTLLEWLDALPPARSAENPWLQYWRGRATLFRDRIAARSLLQAAYDTFVGTGDRLGQLLCAAATLEALFVHYRHFREMDVWIDRMAGMLEAAVPDLSGEEELRVCTALMVAATYRMPEHAILERARARVEALLPGPFDANLKLGVASALHGYENTTLDVSAAELAIRIARPLLRAPEVTAQTAGFYLAMEGYTEYMHGRYEAALARFAEAEAVIAEHGLDEVATNILHWRALTQRRAGLLDAASATLREIDARTSRIEPGFAPRNFISGCLDFDRGRFEDAVPAILAARNIADSGGSFIGKLLVGTVSANVLIGSGEHAEGAALLDHLRSLVLCPVTDHFLGAIELNAAWLAHREGDAAARDAHLADALRRARDPRARERIRWYPNALGELIPIALAQGIEVATVHELVRTIGIAPSGTGVDAWPWKIRIRTLGRFEILVDDEPVSFGRKTPKRTIALLKAIIAFGGVDVPEERLTDALWPGEDADRARRSMGAALHRLRGWLGVAEAVRQRGGALSLDRRLCWVDALALDDPADAPAQDERFLQHYGGPFLDGDSSEAWTLPMRERLRGRFIRVVDVIARGFEASGRFEDAIAQYQRGLAADHLVEAFHQGTIRCHRALGRDAEAMSAYRRLQRTLAMAFGTEPSTESRRLIDPQTRME